MRALVAFAALLLAVPAVAHANRLRVTSYQIDDADGVVELAADQPLREPAVRIDGHVALISFADIDDVRHYDQAGEGNERIRSVHLRAGETGTAVLRIRVDEDCRLLPSQIQITRDQNHALIRFQLERRAPQITPASTHAARGEHAVAPSAPVSAVATTALVAAEPSSVASSTTVRAPVAQPSAAATVLGKRSEAKAQPDAHGFANDSGVAGSRIGVLIAVSLVLGVVYGFLRKTQGAQRAPTRGDIRILGAKRLGHGHQLVLVRALGKDHLLSCAGGHAERIASVASPEGADDAEASDQLAGGGLGIFSALTSKKRMRLLLDEVDKDTDLPRVTPVNREDMPPFGAELLSFVRQQGGRASQRPRGGAAESESVAGITRLRKNAAG